MALAGKVRAFLIITTLLQVSFATVYEVGDSAGWTLPFLGHVNYTNWASNKTFHVGDVIVFTYSKLFHNVKQVQQKQFEPCNDTSPIASYNTGNDSITLKTVGHYYYMCGVPGHCQVGQKVDINVTPVSTSPESVPFPNASLP